jgi:hypothetical protein
MGLLALLPTRKEGVLQIFITLKKSITLAGALARTFESSGKHTNHYTTKATQHQHLGLKKQTHFSAS